VDLKSFKRDVAAGDTLTFELHTLPDCTGPLLSTTNLVVGSDDLSIEEVKPLALKGQVPKPKKLARLVPRLAAPTASIPLFLLVSGDGGPLAGCQAQAAGTARLPSPLWITAYDFDGISSSTAWFHSSAGDVSNEDGRDCMHAPIRLPDGAVLTRFVAYLRDDDPGDDVDVTIFRNPLQDSARLALAQASSIDQFGRQVVIGDVTTEPIVDNEFFFYYVEFCFGGVPFGSHGVWAVAVHFE
jgi:hypothetical protein